ncbi:MAG: isopeptide-forming domain-containing fimbrial protein [Mogibacterium sp.]|nr:isopeptide-forming domain-containing fimbrial protein [Mogibacterium sp.]
MRKAVKRISTIMLTAVLTVIMSVPAMAFAATVPSASDTSTITVNNVDAGSTVTAYQIVKAKYNSNGLVGYEKASTSISLADPVKPTDDEIQAIANGINGGSISGLTSKTLTGSGTTYSATVGAGYWLIIAKGGAETIYNPMLAGVYYTVSGSDNTLSTPNEVNASDYWELNEGKAWAKSSKPTIDKTITNPGSNGNASGDDTAIGDVIKFKIATMIPAYSAEYTEVIYNVTDELSEGLDYDADTAVVVKVGGQEVTAGTDTYSVTQSGQKMTIEFKSAYALAHAGANVEVTYGAKLNENAHFNYDANSNKATTEYSNNPAKSSDTKKIEDKTYHYTFEIDGNVNGKSTTGVNYKNHELIKVDEKGAPQKVEYKSDTTYTTIEHGLGGATFKLTNTKTNKEYFATTNSNGYFEGFKGLDAGTYKLVETAAPKGYTVDSTEHTVVINASYNENGTLKEYSIAIDGENTSTYKATYDEDGVTVKTIEKGTNEQPTTFIKNTKLSELPSTGGTGAFLFTIVGVAIMCAIAVLYFRGRKKDNAAE